ncbi:MAG: flagellar hook-basal body complex protein FliE [Burkholderiales bacterium]|nr:flagellar hook-basal body complex protein FliE [Burkholderiales bacterium]
MKIDAVSFLPADQLPALSPVSDHMAGAVNSPFSAWFGNQLAGLNDKLVSADVGVQQLAAGDASNLHQVMINLEEAKLSLQLMMQVRNHLLDAYHDIAQMQL